MVEATHKAKVVVTGKTGGATAALKKFARETEKAQAKVFQLDKRLAQFSSRADTSARRVERMTARIDALKRKSAALDAQFKKSTSFKNLALGMAKVAAVGVGVAVVVDRLADRVSKFSAIQAANTLRIGKAAAATKGLISNFELMRQANIAQRFGILKTSKEFAAFTTVAVKLGQSVGINARQAVQDLTTAIGRQSTRVLDNLGIILKVGEAHRKYAEKLNVTVGELTDVQKAQAFAIEAMILAEEKAKGLEIGVNKGSAAWTELKTNLINLSDDVMPEVFKGLGMFVKGLDNVTDAIARLNQEPLRLRGIRGIEDDEARLRAIRNSLIAERIATRKIAIEEAFAAAKLQRVRESLRQVALFTAFRQQQLTEIITTTPKRRKPRRRGGRGAKRTPTEIESALGVELGAEARALEFQKGPSGVEDLVAGFSDEATAKKLANIQAQGEAEAEFRNRRIELLELEGADTFALRQAQVDAEIRLRTQLLEVADTEGLRKDIEMERDDLRHQRTLMRIEEEIAAQQKKAEVIANVSGQIGQAFALAGFAAVDAAQNSGKAFLLELGMLAKAKSRELILLATVEAAKSVAAAITLNPVGAAMHGAAAAKLFATAAAVGAVGAGLRGAGGGAVFGGGSRGANVTTFGGGGGATSGRVTVSGVSGGFPDTPGGGSFPDEGALQGAQRQQVGGGGVTGGAGGTSIVNIDKVQVLEPSERVGVAVSASIRRANRAGLDTRMA